MKVFHVFLGTATAVLIIWLFWNLLPFGATTEDAGQWGDKFGSLNTLFTGIALSGLVATLWLQHMQIEEGKAEIKSALEKLADTAEALEDQARIKVKESLVASLVASIHTTQMVGNDSTGILHSESVRLKLEQIEDLSADLFNELASMNLRRTGDAQEDVFESCTKPQ